MDKYIYIFILAVHM